MKMSRGAFFPVFILLSLAAALFLTAASGECRSNSAGNLFKDFQSKKVGDIAAETSRSSAPPAAPKSAKRIRVATYNIQGVSGFFKTGDLAGVVKNMNADFVMLTEAVEGFLIYPDQPRFIAKKCGFPHVIFKGNIRIWTWFEKMGNAVLSRTELYGVSLKDLPKIRKDSEQRGVAIARTRVAGREVVLISAHLSRIIHKDERVKQINFIADLIKSEFSNTPVILAGDLNTSPAEKDVLKPLTDIMDEGFLRPAEEKNLKAADGATIPSEKPDVKFDYIFFSKGRFDIKSFQVVSSQASDHRPFVVEVELK